MAHVEKSIEVEKPVDQVYAQWTQFEDFPEVHGERRGGSPAG